MLFFASVYSFLSGAAGKVLLYTVLAAAVVGGFTYAIREHDARVVAESQAQAAVTAAEAQVSAAKSAQDAVSRDAQVQIQRLTTLAKTKVEIAREPVTQNCVTSPSVVAALRSLQPKSGDPSGSDKDPGSAPILHPTASSPRPAQK